MRKSVYISMIVIMPFYIVSCNSSTKHERGATIKTDTLFEAKRVEILHELIDTLAYATTIEKYRDSIDKNLSNLKMKKLDVFGASAEGGEINIYTTKMDTLKLKATYYGEAGKSEYDIYLRDKKVIFFKDKSTYYVSPLGKESAKIDSITHKSYVLKDNRVLIGKSGGLKIAIEEYEQKSNDIKNLYEEILLQLNEE